MNFFRGLYPLTKVPYGNNQVLNQDGQLMFRCDDDKIEWYLKRDLAEVISPNVIRLKFRTKGPGHVGDAFFLQAKKNICVVCGADEGLSKHHVVPKSYRKHFPDELKSHASYDVVVLCLDCHVVYEKNAFQLRRQIAIEHGMPDHPKPETNRVLRKVNSAASALLRYRSQLPPSRILELKNILREYFQKEPTEQDIEHAASLPYIKVNLVEQGEQVIKNTPDLNVFVQRWRNHFIDTMRPQFMPQGWTLSRSIDRIACDQHRSIKTNP